LLMKRERQGSARDEHEARLNEIPKSQPIPGVVKKLQKESVDSLTFRKFKKIFIKACALHHQQYHDQAPHKIEGQQPLISSFDFHAII
jgi:hypothetical protein